jgi:hypothetical protein
VVPRCLPDPRLQEYDIPQGAVVDWLFSKKFHESAAKYVHFYFTSLGLLKNKLL